jgi:hemoglobin/transferrin/lactoferrin receptor protein
MSITRWLPSLLAAVALALGSVGASAAQKGGAVPLRVTVVDASGAAVPDAEVVVASDGAPVVSGVTSAKGTYELNVAATLHRVTVAHPGFNPVTVDVDLRMASATGVVRIELLPAGIAESVVVTGSRAERDVRTVPYSISVVDAKAIDTSGADSAAEVLRDVPGVQITDTSLAGGKRVRIRGEVGSNVLVLVDGREISEQRSFHGAAPLLLDLSDVDRVEVVRGPSSVVYGSKAIGGTVNFISRPPANQRFAGRASLALTSASQGYDGGASASGTLPWFDYRLSASKSNHDDRRVPDSVHDNLAYTGAEGRLENSAFESDYLTGEIGKRWGTSRLAVRTEYFTSSAQSHTSNDVIESGLAEFQLDLPKQDRRTVSVMYQGAKLSPRIPSLSVTAYQQRRNRDFNQTLAVDEVNFAGPGSRLRVDMAISTIYEQNTAGLLSSLEWLPASGHRVVTGLDLVHDNMDAAVTDSSTTTITLPRVPFPIVESSLESPANESTQISAGAFVQEEWSFRPNWRLVAGARYNVFDSSLDATTNENLTTGSTTRGHLSGSAALLYQPAADTLARVSYSQGYRHPSLLEMYEGTAHGGGGLLFPNPELDPEMSDNYEIGGRFETGPVLVDASTFYTRARDYVTTRLCDGVAPCPAGALIGTDRVYDNVNGATTWGAEASLSYRIGDWPVELFGEGTYLNRRFEYVGYTTSDTGLPSLWGRAGFRVGRTRTSDRGYFVELSTRAASSADEYVSATETLRYPGWAIVSTRAGIDVGGQALPSQLVVEVGNLFDKAYRPAQESLYQPGRHIIAKIVTRF